MSVIQKKICLLGDFAVGKTSLVRRFVEDRFDDKYLSTIGVKISRKTLTRGYGTLNLLVWDLAGGDNFDSSSSYLRGTSGAVIVCDLTRHDTLSAFERYAKQVWAVNPGVPLVFVGNKVDLVEARAITDAELQAVCAALNGSFLLASAKTGEQVEETFLAVAEQLDLQL